MTGSSSSRGHGLPMVFVLLAIVVATMVVVATGVALDSGTAVAATSDATIEATEFTVQSGRVGEGYARCPGNKRAVGGGVVESGPPHYIGVEASGPLDATGTTAQTNDGDVATQWYAAVHNNSPREKAVTFRVFAICSASSDATIEATQFTVAPGQVGEGYARCPGNKRAVGGGVVESGPPNQFVAASGPLNATGTTAQTNDGDVATQWYAAIEGKGDYRVFALCSATSKATIQATPFTQPTTQIMPGEEYAKCPAGQRALGGGVVESGPPNTRVAASGPLNATGTTAQTNDGDVATQWYAAASSNVSLGTVVVRDFRVFAICE